MMYSDIDECSEHKHNCEQVCNDTVPGFECSCNYGYRLKHDNASCESEGY